MIELRLTSHLEIMHIRTIYSCANLVWCKIQSLFLNKHSMLHESVLHLAVCHLHYC